MSIINRLTVSTLLIATFLMGQTAWAATYYVDRLLPGNDNNNGAIDTPFYTIVKCVAVAINPGDTCLVKNGTYTEGILMRASGTAGHPITLKNYPGHTPKIRWGDITNLSLRIELVGPNPQPSLIQYINIEGLEISNGGNAGITMSAAAHIVIRNNYIHHNLAGGILCVFCNSVTLDRNYVWRNGDWTTIVGHGMYIYGQNHTITNNIFFNNLKYGLQCAGYPFDATKATDPNQAGFQATIANNTFAYEDQSSGIVIWQAGAVNTIVENNIFYNNNMNLFGGLPNGVAFLNSGGGHILRNNVNFGSYAATLASGSGSWTEAGNTHTDPLFVTAGHTLPASPDFHLTAGSIAIDTGLNKPAITTVDYFGTPRPQGAAFDVGAHEFSSNNSTPAAPLNLQVR
jgi:hypothetical protein